MNEMRGDMLRCVQISMWIKWELPTSSPTLFHWVDNVKLRRTRCGKVVPARAYLIAGRKELREVEGQVCEHCRKVHG